MSIYYYTVGNYRISYSTVPKFKCPEHGSWKQGDNIRNNKVIEKIKIDNNTTRIIMEVLITKLYKGAKAKCPACGSRIVFQGWHVTVENTSKRKMLAGIQIGSTYVYDRYCKTLKNRKETINRLLNKYRK